MRTFLVASLASVLALSLCSALAAEAPDLAKLDRTIKKEPAYVAKRPLYGLAVFGPKAEKRMWLVLDKSKADQSAYDVLHIDRNADGDLTGADERIAATKDEFRLGEFTDPATGAKHSDFHVRTTGNGPDVWLRLRWRGQFRFDGGYPTSQRAAICASLRNRPMRRWFGSTATPRSDSSASKAQN